MTDRIVSPYKTELDENNAYWMAKLSEEVYLKKSETDQMPDEAKILTNIKNEDDKFISVFGVDNNSSQAALVEHEDYLCMAFRGTNEPKDWLDNLNLIATKQLFGQFHSGFWNAVEDIWEPLDNHCRNLQQAKRRPVFITGHSLGGAMATVAAAKFLHEDRPFTSVYTFGQPRVMTRKTAQIFNTECKSRFFRFHNNNDIVTRIPARIMGYSHVGTYFYITKDKECHQDIGYWFRFLDNVDGIVEEMDLGTKGVDSIEDHDMNEYLDYMR